MPSDVFLGFYWRECLHPLQVTLLSHWREWGSVFPSCVVMNYAAVGDGEDERCDTRLDASKQSAYRTSVANPNVTDAFRVDIGSSGQEIDCAP